MTTKTLTPQTARRARRSRCQTTKQRTRLATYHDALGRHRELVTRQGAQQSILLIDRFANTHDDQRLVAHLPADEPTGNAQLVCAMYLKDNNRGCRCLRASDMDATPLANPRSFPLGPPEVTDTDGHVYRLGISADCTPPNQLSWWRLGATQWDSPQAVSARELIGKLESYEPVRSMTLKAIENAEEGLSTTRLREQIERVCNGPMVLNRGLREAIQRTIEREDINTNVIAIRCGRFRRDSRGNISGETSWLMRRIGLRAEAGKNTPSAWIRTDVLAHIAREGLRIDPREVELT